MNVKKRLRSVSKSYYFWMVLLLADWWSKKVAYEANDYVWNQGISLGMFGDRAWGAGIVLLVLGLLVYWWQGLGDGHWGEKWLIIGGVGNLVDRLSYGQVLDWIWIWPFEINLWLNLADLYITFGVMLVLFREVNISKIMKDD